MKCAILTFYFAHNYGAVWQSYALKDYLQSKGSEVKIVEFIPERVKRVYSLNPFSFPFHTRYFIQQLIGVPKRLKQYSLFEGFIRKELGCKRRWADNRYLEQLMDSDVLICGSDQVWNNDITGNISDYYFDTGNLTGKKISYAASFGKSKLDDYQIECIRKYLDLFAQVSIREEDGKQEILDNSSQNPAIVADPVFLLEKRKWEMLADMVPSRSDNYILFYSLRDDNELVKKTEAFAKQVGLKIVVIHPTCYRQSIKGEQLYNVGPYEFLSLIKGAKVVSTNSFHATAFSMIFEKMLLKVPDKWKNSRIDHLLSMVNVDDIRNDQGLLDFAKADRTKLEDYILASKDYLNKCLE